MSCSVIQPGVVHTGMSDYCLTEEGRKWLPAYEQALEYGQTPVEWASQLVDFLASGEADGRSGCFVSVNDDYRDMAKRAEEIKAGDMHTLRLKTPHAACATASSARPETVNPTVVAVSRRARHAIRSRTRTAIRLIEGIGVEGDAHAGTTVKHRSRVRQDPAQPNLRQVHLIQAELFEELREAGFDVEPGRMGENVTTRDIDVLGLPRGARLHLGLEAVVEITGLRNPCIQLDSFQDGLMAATLDRDADGNVIRKAGVMAVVIAGGLVRPGDAITIELPAGMHEALMPV